MQLARNDKQLIISIDSDDRTLLQTLALEDGIDSDESMSEFLTPILDRENLHWISPEEIGALTDAPIIGELGPEEPGTNGRHVGRWDDESGVTQSWCCPILRRWGFMDYQVISLLRRLLDNGSAVLISGN